MKKLREILNLGKYLLFYTLFSAAINGCEMQPDKILSDSSSNSSHSSSSSSSVSSSSSSSKQSSSSSSSFPSYILPQLPSYPGANSKIAFSEEDPSNKTIWTVNSDGSNLKKVYNTPHLMYGNEIKLGDFSPDGKKFIFATSNKIKITDLEGTVLDEFDRGQNSRSEQDFTWTPDSKSILYGKYVDGIYKYDLSDKTIHEILSTSGYTYDHNPSMSPNLESIAFVHHEYGSEYTIYLMNPNGNNKTFLTNGSSNYDEQLCLTWLDNSHIIWKNTRNEKIDYYDISNKKLTEVKLNVPFSEIKLSPDKGTLSLYNEDWNIYFLDIADLSKGIANVYSNKNLVGHRSDMSWSQDGNYFTTFREDDSFVPDGKGSYQWIKGDGNNVLEIDRKDGTRYKVLEKKDFPDGWTTNHSIDEVRWNKQY